jgi:predicted  nucleic acid-binding Zn-ribbon protein
MNYDKIVEYFAQKVDESRREEFREKASKIKDASEAEALGKEFGIIPTEEDRKALFEIAGSMELSDEMLRNAAGGCGGVENCEWCLGV